MKKKADQMRFVKCSEDIDWDCAKKLRNKYFFDPLAIKDPYTWTNEDKLELDFVKLINLIKSSS